MPSISKLQAVFVNTGEPVLSGLGLIGMSIDYPVRLRRLDMEQAPARRSAAGCLPLSGFRDGFIVLFRWVLLVSVKFRFFSQWLHCRQICTQIFRSNVQGQSIGVQIECLVQSFVQIRMTFHI